MNPSTFSHQQETRLFIAPTVTLAILSAAVTPFAALADIPAYADVTTLSEINIVLTGDKRYDTGGGLAWIDFDNDDDPDLYVPAQNAGEASYLYRNDNGIFTNVAAQAGVELTERACTGAVVGDVNNDGYDDLFVTCGAWYPDLDTYPDAEVNALFLNLGNDAQGNHLGFQDITVSAGLAEDGGTDPSYAAAFGDIDGDGDLDLYVGNYGAEFWDTNQYAQPYLCAPNHLYINNGNGTYTDQAAAWGVSDGTTGCALGITLTDYDHDGDLDIFVINEGGNQSSNTGIGKKDGVIGAYTLPRLSPHRMYRNDGNGQFVEVGSSIGVGDGSNAMGVAIGDYDNDDDIDFYVTDMRNEFLYTNNGKTFVDEADSTGATLNDGVSWGAVFFDPDNDGFSDIYAAHGGMARRSNRPNLLFMNNGDGSFSESGLEAGVADVVQNPKGGIGRGTAVADFNRDGKEDIFITNINGETSRLLKNVTPDNGNNWLSIRLGGTISNKRGIGAKVRVTSGQGTSSKTQLKEVHAGSGHGSSNDLSRLHFGLGDAAFATLVTVEWPSGCTQILSRVDPGVVDITENCSP